MLKINTKINEKRSVSRTFVSLFAKVGMTVALGAAALTAPSAWAGWNAQQENVQANHPTWIYTPTTASVLPSGKRALLIVLHGCDQTNTQLKEWGNLTPGADAKGAVIAVPYVGTKVWNNNTTSKCWDYDGATDTSGHVAELVTMAQTLAARSALNIDSNHVYISGMSAGASVALLAACKAPDVFAGVSAIAGPSITSSQMSAIADAGSIFVKPETAAAKCKALAGTAKAKHLDTQIANISYGEMDKNAENPGCQFSANATNCPGTFKLISKKWGTINADAYKLVYGTSALSTPVVVPASTGEASSATVANKVVLSFTRIYKVGHGWPAGSGQANDINKGGVWVAQTGMDFTSYILDWLITNNRRPPAPLAGPVVTSCPATVAASSVTVSGTGEDQSGTIVSYSVVLTGATAISDPAAGNGASFSKSYSLADGVYTGSVKATDNNGAVSEPCSIKSFRIGAPPVVIILPPTNLAVASTTASSVSLTWTASTDASAYNVYRDGTKITATPVAATGYTDTGLEASKDYKYKVTAVNASSESDLSAEVTGTTKAPSAWTCTTTTSNNVVHVMAGRAQYIWTTLHAAAKGSKQDMGWYNMFVTTTLAQTAAGYYVIGACPK